MTMAASSWRRRGGWTASILFAVVGLLLLPFLPSVTISRVPIPSGAHRVRVAAGSRYQAGAVQRFFQGSHYRELWTTPIEVEVLALGPEGAGLRPIREGGGKQTRTLHFVGSDARDYVFRSVDKELTRLVDHRLGRSMFARLLQDQTKGSHPAAPLIVAPLQARLGLPNGHPRFVVLPDDSALGPFRGRFAGLLGTLQENPAGGPDVAETDEVLGLTAGDSARHRIDARTYLVARVFDLFLNDWDRHEKQWRWIPETTPDGKLWRPVPVDRDQAFSWYDGMLMQIARLRSPKLATFGPEYPPIRGLAKNALELDRRILAGLDRPTWDSAAAFVAARMDDAAIEDAVRRMPGPYWEKSGPWLTAVLRARRDRLADVVDSFDRLVQPGADSRVERIANGPQPRRATPRPGSER
jgi:hypothetical protein